ncbi:hypothetical protein N9S98_00380 [Alphaproteobacteria bacterium]|nr:hypothetical protein [Alphaproteobacteria bacterium]
MGDSPSSDSGSNNESRMSPGRATAQFGSEVGSLAGGYTESQVQDAIDQNESSDDPRTNVEIARDAPVPTSTVAETFSVGDSDYVPTAALTPAAIASLPISQTNMMRGADNTDFNFANSNAAQQLRDNTNLTGGLFPAIDAIAGFRSQGVLNDLNRGQVPDFQGPRDAQGRLTISGTTGQGFGMASPDGLLKGYEPFSPVIPTTNVNMNMGGDDGGDNNQQAIIRRNPSDPVQDDPTDPVISDELASDYLQNPFYLYSGQNNLYQPYGYAANTLVNLLRTRNMTQPQQAAANLGLFGNPGDFS